MKKLNLFIIVLTLSTIYWGCKKSDDPAATTPSSSTSADNYTSMAQFHQQNGVPMQTHLIDAVAGGSFTTAQGTIVTVPPNAFKTQGGAAVTGTVTIQFKDIYKKSDMLLSDKPTNYFSGIPLKSGGEFFIKALQSNVPLIMAAGKKIDVTQPLNGIAVDTLIKPMVLQVDTSDHSWHPDPIDSLHSYSNSYIFSLYQYNTPVDSGSWCNSDNSNYFSAFPQTILTLNPTDPIGSYTTEVYLLFSNLNSMVHVYPYLYTNFPYNYAPLGAQCTVVAVGVSGGKLYSAFVPITITSNMTVNFTLSQTTTTAFKAAINALN